MDRSRGRSTSTLCSFIINHTRGDHFRKLEGRTSDSLTDISKRNPIKKQGFFSYTSVFTEFGRYKPPRLLLGLSLLCIYYLVTGYDFQSFMSTKHQEQSYC